MTKYKLQNKRWLDIFLVHMRSLLKNHLGCYWQLNELSSGTVVDWMHIGNLDDSIMVFEEFFGNLDLLLKVSNTINHPSVLMTHIFIDDMMRSYWLQLL
jgi:hypothetical protein